MAYQNDFIDSNISDISKWSQIHQSFQDISKLLNPKSFEVAILWEPSESFP